MIIPAWHHSELVKVDATKSVRLVTCKRGTFAELWSTRYDRPIKNGKLFMIENDGSLTLFNNVNKLSVDVDTNGCIRIRNH